MGKNNEGSEDDEDDEDNEDNDKYVEIMRICDNYENM